MNIDKLRIAKEVQDFLQALCDLDFPALETNWAVSRAVSEEIRESLERYSDDSAGTGFAPPPLSEKDIHISGRDNNERAPLRLFELNSGDGLSAECTLWFKGKASDLTALMDIFERDSNRYAIDFRMLEVQ